VEKAQPGGCNTGWQDKINALLLNSCHNKQVSVDSEKFSGLKKLLYQHVAWLYFPWIIIVACAVGANLFALRKAPFYPASLAKGG